MKERIKYKTPVKIYCLIDTDGYVFYVGRTQLTLKERLSAHYHCTAPTEKLGKFIDHLKRKGSPIEILELDECDFPKRRIMEEYWIQQMATWGYNLFNVRHNRNKGWQPRRVIPCEIPLPEERFLAKHLYRDGDYTFIARIAGKSPQWVKKTIGKKKWNKELRPIIVEYYKSRAAEEVDQLTMAIKAIA